MVLNIRFDQRDFAIEVPEDILGEAGDFFAKMDGDMNRGWQMGREYVENPSDMQRVQIAADKIVSALYTGNRQLATLMAAYILAKFPDTRQVDVDTTGNMQETRLYFA